jgi:hypothetical protein
MHASKEQQPTIQVGCEVFCFNLWFELGVALR